MKTKYVCRCLISLYVIFYNNRTTWSTKSHVKIYRWGEKEKEPPESDFQLTREFLTRISG